MLVLRFTDKADGAGNRGFADDAQDIDVETLERDRPGIVRDGRDGADGKRLIAVEPGS